MYFPRLWNRNKEMPLISANMEHLLSFQYVYLIGSTGEWRLQTLYNIIYGLLKKTHCSWINSKSFDNLTSIHCVKQPWITQKTTQTVQASFHSQTSARCHSSKGRIQRTVSLISYSDWVDICGSKRAQPTHSNTHISKLVQGANKN